MLKVARRVLLMVLSATLGSSITILATWTVGGWGPAILIILSSGVLAVLVLVGGQSEE
jgi:hypothetical protein